MQAVEERAGVLVLGLAGVVDVAAQRVAQLVQGGVMDDRHLPSRRPPCTRYSQRLRGGLDLGVHGRAAAREHAAVDRQRRAGDPATAPPPARKRIASTTSAGLAAAAERVEAADRVEHLLGLLVGEEALVGGRLDERERDRVDADALGRELEREVLGQRVAAGLGGGVGARRRGGDRVDAPTSSRR